MVFYGYIEEFRAKLQARLGASDRYYVILAEERLMYLDLEKEKQITIADGAESVPSKDELEMGDIVRVQMTTNDRVIAWRFTDSKRA